ncbi:MAG TPA: LPS-assembly protein LptD, partial [Brevundimonas sp.]|nr:LPS-assembly protein LptD [Brevundimonas sp.]
MQRDRRASDSAAPRHRLLAGVAAVALAAVAGGAWAQTTTAPTAPPGSDGLTPDAVYLEADVATRAGDVITASGSGADRVLARFRGATLRAGELSYDLGLGVATAQRQVEFVDPGGSIVFASYLEMDADLRAGVAVDFATRFTNGASLMAATAVRRSENVNELNYAIFTPCPICDSEGRPREPTISIQAEKVVQDEALRAVLYRNAVFRVAGTPIFYLPFFAHPDPTVERASGFL